jgi:hypothetical protein
MAQPSYEFRPVTIADLKRDSKLLEVGCLACGRHLYIDAAGAGLPDELPVPQVAARLTCSGCKAINQPTWHPIWARPDARAPAVL